MIPMAWVMLLGAGWLGQVTTPVQPALQQVARLEIKLEVRPFPTVARNSAPQWIEVKIRRKGGKGLIQGRVVLESRDRRGVVWVLRPENPIVLAEGDPVDRYYLLPSVETEFPYGVSEANVYYNLKATFIAEDSGIRVAQDVSIGLPARGERNTTLLRCGLGARQLEERLQLHAYQPDGLKDPVQTAEVRKLLTYSTDMKELNLPVDPNGYLAFDGVVLDAVAFDALNGQQLSALETWVRAGGSLCVQWARAMETEKREFLNRLADSERQAPRWTNRNGQVVIEPVEPIENVMLLSPGLGRVVAVLVDYKLHDSSVRWREAVAWFWKMRRDQAGRLMEYGRWRYVDFSATPEAQVLRRNSPFGEGGEWESDPVFSPHPVPEAESLVSMLMPPNVRMVPVAVVLSILAALVVLIGPVDWLFLGVLRQRKWTWVFLPASAMACTGLVMVIGERYMESSSEVRSLVIDDVDTAGRILRRNTLSLYFLGHSQVMRWGPEQGLVQELDIQKLVHGSQMSMYADVEQLPKPEPAIWSGSLVARPESEKLLFKWVRSLYRMQTLKPEIAAPFPPIDWKGLVSLSAPAGLSRIDPDSIDTAELLRGSLGEDFHGAVLVLERGQWRELSSGGGRSGDFSAARDLIQRLSTRRKLGLFSIVSRVSPMGDVLLEDLALVDESDAAQRLVVVVKKEGDTLWVQRCLIEGAKHVLRAD